jgi:hypothetical protein
MRPQTMTVLALMCLAGSSPAVSAAWRAPMPSEIPAAQSLPAATQAAVWFAGETALPTGVALLASGQWMPVRDGRWLWIAYDQGSERAAPSFVVAYEYTYYLGIGWRRVVAGAGPDPALFVHTPVVFGGTPALGFGSMGEPASSRRPSRELMEPLPGRAR